MTQTNENNAMGFLPALGWNSWNTFTWDINETLIKEIADCFKAKVGQNDILLSIGAGDVNKILDYFKNE